jgi:CBS domain containing-hemolysin-like protein
MINLVLLILAVVLISALFAGTEAAVLSIPYSRVLLLEKQKVRGSKSLAEIKKNFSKALAVIIIGNNIFSIVGSIFVGVVATRLYGDVVIGIVSAILTTLIIFFGDILPKIIGENNSEKISLRAAPVLLFLTKVLYPIVWLVEQMSLRLTKNKKIVSEEELRMLSNLGHLEGSIEQDERDIIERVFTLNDLTAYDIMTPRTVMVGLPIDHTLGELRTEIFELTNSRLPIYGEDYDDIRGLCHRRDLLVALAKDEDSRDISTVMKNIMYVSEDIRVDHLLMLFLERREHLAIVKDEFDGTSGLVTLEDVLEQLVGEIVDESDEFVDTREEAKREAEDSDIVVEDGDDQAEPAFEEENSENSEEEK